MTDQKNDDFGTWGVLELMGHVKLAGYITNEKLFGVEIGRIDIPSGDSFITQYFGGSAVYRMTPVSEEIARAFSAQNQPRPVYIYELELPERIPDDDDDDSPDF